MSFSVMGRRVRHQYKMPATAIPTPALMATNHRAAGARIITTATNATAIIRLTRPFGMPPYFSLTGTSARGSV